MGIILWILLGALAGWIASKIMKTDAQQGAVANVIVGILGAFVGGWIMNMFGGNGADLGTINLYSILVAIGGAIVLLFLYRLVAGRR